jgi:hypothetical protein
VKSTKYPENPGHLMKIPEICDIPAFVCKDAIRAEMTENNIEIALL